jgi:hypothetical protein
MVSPIVGTVNGRIKLERGPAGRGRRRYILSARGSGGLESKNGRRVGVYFNMGVAEARALLEALASELGEGEECGACGYADHGGECACVNCGCSCHVYGSNNDHAEARCRCKRCKCACHR